MIWLLPLCLGFVLPAMYIGGWPRDLRGGTPVSQVLGLVMTIALFNVVWAVLHRVLGNVAGALGWLVLPTVVSTLAFPALATVSFRVFGVRIVREAD